MAGKTPSLMPPRRRAAGECSSWVVLSSRGYACVGGKSGNKTMKVLMLWWWRRLRRGCCSCSRCCLHI